MKLQWKHIFALACFFVFNNSYFSYGEIKLPELLSNNMVLQRNAVLKLWGWASVAEKVSVMFNGKHASTITKADGCWYLELPPMKAGGPFVMTFRGTNAIQLSGVLIGDVWFCSGQSNMKLQMREVKEKYSDEIVTAQFPEIRNFLVGTDADITTEHDNLPSGKWLAANPQNVLTFGATSYFFAKTIYLKYHVPIGLINSSVGGTPVEAWISVNGYKSFPKYLQQLDNFKDTAFLNNLSRHKLTGSSKANAIPLVDRGISDSIKWYNISYVPKGWHKFWMPGYWADQGVKDLNGILWFRKEINVPVSMTGQPAKITLGRIINADQTYLNGVMVGSSSNQFLRRRYHVPSGILKPGKNIVIIRVTNTFNKGGFVPDKEYDIVCNGETIDLKGDWIYQIGQIQIPNVLSKGGTAPNLQKLPTSLYNTMVAPLTNYTIKGFLWYQGEENISRGKEYEQLFQALITDWRSKWKNPKLPFIFAQLPNFMDVNYLPSESQWAELRQSQFKALALPYTGMAVTIDAGEWNDIHPLNKETVGKRLALEAEHLAYGNDALVYSGPIYRSAIVVENKVIITLSNTGGGLEAKGGGDLYYFSIAGRDEKYVWAKATISGDKITVWNDAITNPVSVRYAWADNPEGANLYNKEGLPASPFETGDLQ